jgi:hypothetical protein
MSIDTGRAEMFKAGGTLHLNAPSYVNRPADEELFRQVLAGQFCYVLTPRQMGKSSLMVRTAHRLRQAGILTAIVDLSGLGTRDITHDQWYLSIIKCLVHDLQLASEPEQWWEERAILSPVQRFSDFLHEVVLGRDNRIVIFIDEIDSTIKLNFTDDFFAAIRAVYNQRATNTEYNRLTFVLLGVSTPTDLVKNRHRTPFNIGQAIDLREFSRADAQPLEHGLEQIYPGWGRPILNRIFDWTGGHPYLTQKLCQAISASSACSRPDLEIEKIVKKLFFLDEAQKEDNLQFVRSHVEESPERRQLLRLYRRIYTDEVIVDDERSLLQNRLKLIGLVGSRQGRLHIRNKIYRRVFNLAWIKRNTPFPWTQMITVVALVISLVAIIAAGYIDRVQRAEAVRQIKIDLDEETDATHRIFLLGQLCAQDRNEARQFFATLEKARQMDLFHNAHSEQVPQSLPQVIDCLAPVGWEERPAEDNREVVNAMCRSLTEMSDGTQTDVYNRLQCKEKSPPRRGP